MRIQTQSDIRPIVLRVAAKWINFELILHWVSCIALFSSLVPSLSLSPSSIRCHCALRLSHFVHHESCSLVRRTVCRGQLEQKRFFFVPTGFIIQFIIRLFLPLCFFFSLPLSCSLPIHCAVCQHKSMHIAFPPAHLHSVSVMFFSPRFFSSALEHAFNISNRIILPYLMATQHEIRSFWNFAVVAAMDCQQPFPVVRNCLLNL